jgi:hypothetical protein
MPSYKPNGQGLGKGYSLDKTRYYQLYYQMYKHRYKYRQLEKKNEKNTEIDYKQQLIDCGFLIIK